MWESKKKAKKLPFMKTQNKKWGQERKYDVKTEKCVKKFTVCFYGTVNVFLVGHLIWKISQFEIDGCNVSHQSLNFKWSSQVYQFPSHIVSKQIIQIHKISFEKSTPTPLAVILTGISSTWRWTLDQFSVTS